MGATEKAAAAKKGTARMFWSSGLFLDGLDGMGHTSPKRAKEFLDFFTPMGEPKKGF